MIKKFRNNSKNQKEHDREKEAHKKVKARRRAEYKLQRDLGRQQRFERKDNE